MDKKEVRQRMIRAMGGRCTCACGCSETRVHKLRIAHVGVMPLGYQSKQRYEDLLYFDRTGRIKPYLKLLCQKCHMRHEHNWISREGLFE